MKDKEVLGVHLELVKRNPSGLYRMGFHEGRSYRGSRSRLGNNGGPGIVT